MDAWEATKVVFERVHALDPDNASKMMGKLLIQDNSDRELIRLAFGPDHLLHAFVSSARAELPAKPASPPSPPVLSSPWGGCGEYDGGGPSPGGGVDHQSPFGGDAFYPENEYGCWSPASGGYRRSLSLSDAEAGAWRPCVYFARGYCKNGSSCRFLHDDLPVLDDSTTAAEQEMAVMRAKALDAERMASAFPFSSLPRPKGISLNFLLHHQQQHEHSQSMYGPVQDVRIPYQHKRMFGFVTFVYEESVRIILNKGNPHFVCNSRVLVKPYKEKGKFHDRFRKLHHQHHGDFTGCTSPTGLLDSRDPFDLQQPQIGPRMMYGNIADHEALLRRKLEAQHQAAELQQAIELEGQRFVRLQLLDLKSKGYHLGSTNSLGQANSTGNINGNGNAVNLEDFTIQGLFLVSWPRQVLGSLASVRCLQGGCDFNSWFLIVDNKVNSSGLAMSVPASATISAADAEGRHEEQQEEDADANASPKQAFNPGEEEKMESVLVTTPNVARGFQENGAVEHILPESPFASPTKASADTSTTAQNVDINNSSPYHVVSSLFPPTSIPELSPYNSCFFQVPRFSPGHEAIGL
ncbi:unnamed protein product [Urochloa decumbens]|uniref:C3H1-type domain-containing protein n=1 Tax=Urochloa decumbens TaxID=240449 RepID=A0ABC9B8N5_9POAL